MYGSKPQAGANRALSRGKMRRRWIVRDPSHPTKNQPRKNEIRRGVDVRPLLAVLLVSTGCAGAKAEEPKPPAVTSPKGSPPTVYSFRVRWSYGPCPDGPNARSCHQEVYFLGDGTVQSFVWPSPKSSGQGEGPPAFAEKKVPTDTWTKIGTVLDSAGFKAGMRDGFHCQPDYDATIRVEQRENDKLVSQEVTHCEGNAARQLLDLVEGYRYLAGDR